MATELVALSVVKNRLWGDDTNQHQSNFDDLLQDLIDEYSERAEETMGRVIASAATTEYYDGTGKSRLYLRNGPMVTLTRVDSVEYGNDGAGAQTQTLTEVVAADMLAGGLASENWRGRAWIDMVSGTWTRGKRNFKVQATLGFAAVPKALRGHACRHIIAEFNLREGAGLASTQQGDGGDTYLSPSQVRADFERGLEPWCLYGDPVV